MEKSFFNHIFLDLQRKNVTSLCFIKAWNNCSRQKSSKNKCIDLSNNEK